MRCKIYIYLKVIIRLGTNGYIPLVDNFYSEVEFLYKIDSEKLKEKKLTKSFFSTKRTPSHEFFKIVIL